MDKPKEIRKIKPRRKIDPFERGVRDLKTKIINPRYKSKIILKLDEALMWHKSR